MIGRLIRAAFVGAAALAIGGSALAQFGGGGGREAFAPGINSREIETYSKILGLSEDQTLVVEDLFAGYQTQFDDAAQTVRREMDAIREEFRDTRDPGVWRDMRETMQAFRDESKKFEEAFFNDVKLLLTEEQMNRWGQLERTRRRERTLRQGFLSGETVDLIRVVEDMKLDEATAAAIQPVLGRYEEELDRALIERNARYEEGMRVGLEVWQSGNMEQATEMFEKSREAGIAVRDVNRRFARQLESELGGERASEFAAEFQRRSFPRVYRKTYADRMFETVQSFEDLNDEQKQSIGELKATYSRERGSLDSKWATMIEQAEVSRTLDETFGRGRGGPDPAQRDLRRSRVELDERTAEKLRTLLTEEQASKLPEPGDDDDDDDDDGRERRRQGPPGERRRGQVPNEV